MWEKMRILILYHFLLNLSTFLRYVFYTFSSVQSLSPVQVFATPWTAAHQASLSITNSQSFTQTHVWTSLVAQTVKCLPTMQETWVQSLGQEDPLEKEIATHCSTLAWKIPWVEEPGRLQSMGSQNVRLNWVTSLSFFSFMSIESVMPSNHLILCCPLLLLPSMFPNIRVLFSNEFLYIIDIKIKKWNKLKVEQNFQDALYSKY